MQVVWGSISVHFWKEFLPWFKCFYPNPNYFVKFVNYFPYWIWNSSTCCFLSLGFWILFLCLISPRVLIPYLFLLFIEFLWFLSSLEIRLLIKFICFLNMALEGVEKKNINFIRRMLFEIFYWMLCILDIDILSCGVGVYCISICWAFSILYYDYWIGAEGIESVENFEFLWKYSKRRCLPVFNLWNTMLLEISWFRGCYNLGFLELC